MTDHQITPTAITRYDTISHEEGLVDGPGATPYRYNMRAVHGAALAADFKEALLKLEALMYVIYGGQPDYAGAEQWYTREHPRCRWNVEQWWEQPEDNPPPDQFWNYLETAALGAFKGGTAPIVPVKTRSGDPAVQFKYAGHSAYFPEGSVERYVGSPGTTGHQVHDPASTFKQFSAWPDSEDVVIRYTEPVGKTATSVDLVTASGTTAMTEVSPGVWEATISAQTQGSWVDWYVAAEFSDDPGETHYDPYAGSSGGSEIAPTLAGQVTDPEHDRPAGVAYSFVFYSHYNPYAGGLPELLDEYEPHEASNYLRRGTDAYEFDSSENIQPHLINLVRFVLDEIGKIFEHPPGSRGDSDLCCYGIPIIWRWSGSNSPDLYRAGGKSGSSPLHNNPSEGAAGSSDARKSWRGIEMAWRNASTVPGLFPDNIYYGDTETWLSWESRLILEPDPLNPPFEALIRQYDNRGLNDGDVIDPVHLLEIVDAVDYLITTGLWRNVAIYRTKRTPGSFNGDSCGYYWIDTSEGGGESGVDSGCAECCETCDDGAGTCTTWDSPTWADCQGHNAKCIMRKVHERDNGYIAGDGSFWIDSGNVYCDFARIEDPGHPKTTTYPMGAYANSIAVQDCIDGDVTAEDHTSFRVIFGESYYLCGPEQNPNGPDEYHGNEITKTRFDHDGNFSSTGPSMGNRFGGSIQACIDPGSPGVPGFESVAGVYRETIADHWINEQVSGSFPDFDYFTVPGLGIYDYDGETLLTYPSNDPASCPPPPGGTGYTAAAHGVYGDFVEQPSCGDFVYVRIDLNLDGNGIPRLYDYNLGIGSPFDECPCKTWTGASVCE